MEIASNVTRVTNKPRLNETIGDTGTTGNFVIPGMLVDDIKVVENPIEIEMPNEVIEQSTHICYLRIPYLPRELSSMDINIMS